MEEDGSITSLPFAEVEVLRSNLLNAAKSDALGRFARWVLAERPARTVSPTSTLTVAGYVQRLLSQEGHSVAEEAVRIEPTNAVALCRLAIATAKDPENPHRFAEATVYFNRASRFGLGAQEAERVRATLADLGRKP